MKKANGFPRTEKIKDQAQFDEIFRNAKKFSDNIFKIYFIIRNSGKTKLGVIISRKIKGSVTRNRHKRLIREYYRQNKQFFHVGLEIVVILYRELEIPTYQAMKEKLDNILRMRNLLK